MAVSRLILTTTILLVLAGIAQAGDASECLQLIHAAAQQFDEGKYGVAEESLARALILARTDHADSPLEATILSNLGDVANETGRFKEAERYYRRSISIWERQGAPGQEPLSRPLNNLAVAYAQMGRYAAAKQLYLRSLAIRTDVKGVGHPDLAPVLNSLCHAERSMGKYSEAEQHCRRAIGILTSSGNGVTAMLPHAYTNLALVFADQKDFVTASVWIDQALTLAARTSGIRSTALIQILFTRSEIQLGMGLRDDAAETLHRAESLAEEHLTGNHPVFVGILLLRARLLRNGNQDADARKLERKAEAIINNYRRENKLEHTVDVSDFRSRRNR